MTEGPIILAGASGDLGRRICAALLGRGAAVTALLRADASGADEARIAEFGVTVVRADASDVGSLAAAMTGATCVVSALNGLRDVIIERQGVLLEAAVQAGVRRFIPSDYSADFTKVAAGDNRNFDLRREFMARADRARIQVTSVLNGAFMDMLGREMPIIQRGLQRVLYVRDVDQPLDFTTKHDVAAYVAAAAVDEATPRFLRIAGDTASAREIAQLMTEVSGQTYRPLWVGSLGSLGLMIRIAKLVAPQPDVTFPPWQGMQYLRDMFSGRAKLHPLDNARYPDLSWTSLRQQLAKAVVSAI